MTCRYRDGTKCTQPKADAYGRHVPPRVCAVCDHYDGPARGAGDRVEAVQEFAQADYAGIKDKLKPVGGGGTTVSCVARWLSEHKRRPQALIYMTDGYIESQYVVPDVPCLWGVIDNSAFVPRKGKVVHIQSGSL